MYNPFKNNPFKKSNSVVGIDLGSSAIKVMQLRKNEGRVILETYGELAAGAYGGRVIGQAVSLPIEKTKEALTDLFKEANITTQAVSFAIPLRSSLLVTIEIPAVDESQLPTVIPIEARKYVPVPISEVALDWWVVPGNLPTSLADRAAAPGEAKPPTLEVLLAAIHKTTLQQYEELGRALGVTTAFFEIETFSVIRSTLPNDMSPFVILDLGAGSTKMVIVDYGVIRLSHTINKGSQDVTTAIAHSLSIDFAKAEEIKRRVGLVEDVGPTGTLSIVVSPILEYIFAEANRVMLDYQKRRERPIAKVIMIGGGLLLKGLAAVAKNSFEVPVVAGQPFTKVETPAFLEQVLVDAGPPFAVSIGLALRHLQGL